MRVKAVKLPSIEVSITVIPRDGHFDAVMDVRNKGSKPIDLVPSIFTIQMTNPTGNVLAALPPDRVMAKRSVLDMIAAAGAGAGQGWSDASQKGTTTATITNPDGTVSRVEIPNNGPTQQEIDQRARVANNRQKDANARAAYNEGISKMALLPNTVYPSTDISGTVFFPIEKKKYSQIIIRLPIAGTVFEFPFEF